VTAASFKFKYSGAAFLVVVLAAAAVGTVLLVRDQADTRTLSALAERAARERVDPELQARAQSIAAHAADSIAGAVRAGDSSGVVRRLQPFIDDATVAAITVAARSGKRIFDWRRSAGATPGALSAEVTAPVRTFVENIPGAATPETLASLTVVLEQAAPVPEVTLGGRLEAASAERTRLTWLLGLALAAAILIFGVLIPLDRSVAHAHDRLAHKRADLTWMQGVAPELAASAPAPAATGESLLVIIDRSARESGLGGALAGSEPGGPGSLSVRLAKAPFDTVVGWLGRLAQQNGLSVESATIEKTDTPGLVNAAIVLHSG